MSDERRHFQRLTLLEPIDGWFGDYAVRLIDVSATGALIEYDEPIPADARALLRFWWRDEEVELMAETARTLESRSGLHFLEENEALCRLIAGSATEMLIALEANARGDREANLIGDETLTAAWRRPMQGFVRWIFGDGGWRSEQSAHADQPENGFTIAAAEPDDQVALLCRTYESGGTEARQLTRMLAELSVAAAG
ncbi:MAG TPA: PilZ domain-containing protein [Thermoanaerobaculia bacterium]|nr:PilZ domain-containing protein [Thermoanaerobaculia bacterium]